MRSPLFRLLLMIVLISGGCTSAPRDNSAARMQPTVHMWHELVYDNRRQAILLVNGSSASGTPAADNIELWEWTGRNWSLVSAEGPPWRSWASAAFDTRRNVLVVYGGLQGELDQEGHVLFADTWEWDGSSWTRHNVPGPGSRVGHGMTFDPVRGVVLLFGGTSEGEIRGDTWTWDGRAWSKVGTAGPPPRYPAALSFDGTRGEVLLFGGHVIDDRGFLTFDDTWTWDGSRWQELDRPGPSGRDGARSAFHAENGQTVVFGGYQTVPTRQNMDDTWIWNGDTWTLTDARGPVGRVHHAMAYNPVRRRTLLFGGFNKPGPPALPDVWEWNGTTWTCKAACPPQ